MSDEHEQRPDEGIEPSDREAFDRVEPRAEGDAVGALSALDTTFTRRAFVSGSAVALGAAVVWTSPFPFADKAIGQFMDSAWADATGATGTTGTSGGSGGGGGGGGTTTVVNTITTSGATATLIGTGLLDGSVNILGGSDGVSWAAGAFAPATITLAESPLAANVGGFAAGSTVLTLTVTDGAGHLITSFSLPLRIHVASPGGFVAPSYSADGVTWRLIPRLASPALGPGMTDGYFLNADGSYDIYTLHASSFALLKDIQGPTAPGSFAGRFEHGVLLLSWTPATDNSGLIDHYQLDLNGAAASKYAATATTASIRKLGARHNSAFVLHAVDPAGNVGAASKAVTAKPVARPKDAPKLVPHWAFKLLAWEERPAKRRGPRPETPSPLPDWYAPWKAWRLEPFKLEH